MTLTSHLRRLIQMAAVQTFYQLNFVGFSCFSSRHKYTASLGATIIIYIQ